MTNHYTPELGQACFGNPTGEYECPEYVHAMLTHLLWLIGIDYGNKHREDWVDCGMPDPEIPDIAVRPYWWGDEDAPGAALPNFAFGNAEIRWYKYPGRGMTVNVNWSPAEWVAWFDSCCATISQHERAVGW